MSTESDVKIFENNLFGFGNLYSRPKRSPVRAPSLSEKSQAKKVRCPYCGAGPGSNCRTPSNRKTRVHRVRIMVGVAVPGGSFRLTEDESGGVDEMTSFWGAHPDNGEVYQPRDSALLPEEGAWAMIIRQLPPLEHGVDQHFRPGRIFFLFFLEQVEGADAEGFQPDGSYKARTQSPWGEVCFWPYEYAVQPIERVISFWQEGEIIFHPLNVEQARLNEVTFYARSRGIGLADAAVMALGSLSEPVGWFEPREDLAPEMEALASRINTSLAEHIRQNPRDLR